MVLRAKQDDAIIVRGSDREREREMKKKITHPKGKEEQRKEETKNNHNMYIEILAVHFSSTNISGTDFVNRVCTVALVKRALHFIDFQARRSRKKQPISVNQLAFRVLGRFFLFFTTEFVSKFFFLAPP